MKKFNSYFEVQCVYSTELYEKIIMKGKGFARSKWKVKLNVAKVAEEKYERLKTNSQHSIGTGDVWNKMPFIV
jgi:hypothetical protein